uniref:NADH dehydrogenase subunit 4L n=1 Tax=Geukensia demissa TaxID=27807 RepID=UPI001FB01925|nr:NADH dehydrogenase subunit 4L [Geukensia demissa]UJM44212.1 NADH dehydrogenase subunit 4L [Geukensia demissa]
MNMMMLMIFVVSVFIVFVQSKHLISVFIAMEFMSLSLIVFTVLVTYSNACIVLVVMCMAVCEASLALAMIVMLVRVCGSDRAINLMSDKS